MSIVSVQDMAIYRYYDWVITTPLMLISIIIYFTYEEYLQKEEDKKIEFVQFIYDNKSTIITIVLANLLMLIFGYLGELEVIDKWTSVVVGFIFFVIAFYTIYKEYASKSVVGNNVFNFILIIWGMYGIAFMLDKYTKNNFYNILDIFAKNFFGLYLFYRAKNIQNKIK
jgi:bacteriorhodopsin